MSDGSGSDVAEGVEPAQGAANADDSKTATATATAAQDPIQAPTQAATQAPTEFTRLMNLPIEVRHIIYGFMVTISRGPQGFICYPNGHIFLTGLDPSFPWIATLSPEVFRYVMHPSRFQRISLDFALLQLIPSCAWRKSSAC